jgi:hypothetical protein
MVTTHGLADAADNAEICDDATPKDVRIAQFAQGAMGLGAQVGSADRRFAVYDPTTRTADGAPWGRGVPVTIEGGKTRVVTGNFVLNTDHRTNYNILILCPTVKTVDINNIGDTAICRGVTVASNGHGGGVESTSLLQFRILPHSKTRSCPAPPQS